MDKFKVGLYIAHFLIAALFAAFPFMAFYGFFPGGVHLYTDAWFFYPAIIFSGSSIAIGIIGFCTLIFFIMLQAKRDAEEKIHERYIRKQKGGGK